MSSYVSQSSSKYPKPGPVYTGSYSPGSYGGTSAGQPYGSSAAQNYGSSAAQNYGSSATQNYGSSATQNYGSSTGQNYGSGSASFVASSKPASYSSSPSASTTYGVPHPTHGVPEPPSYTSFSATTYPKDQSDQATSYVHFYQSGESKDPQTPASAQPNAYSYSSTHYQENKHKGSVFDSDLGSDSKPWNHQLESKEKRSKKTKESDSAGSNFKAPKQTYGFLPYETDSRGSKEQDSFTLSQGYYADSVLSPNYYDQQQQHKQPSTSSS